MEGSYITDPTKYLQLKLNQVASRHLSDKVALFRGFYDDIADERLKELFAIFHMQFNNLFAFMNQKRYASGGGHFNADVSRDLIDLIEQERVIQATLKGDFAFEINDYYEEIMGKCRSFLSMSGGSSIPEDFPPIDIIEDKPIFTLVDTMTIPGTLPSAIAKLKFIGEGSYAKVLKYKDPHYNSYFAVKRAEGDLRPDELERFKNEYNDLRTLDSLFVIKAYSYDDEKNEYVMEYADETLSKYINRSNSTLTFNKRRVYVEQLIRAFDYIHSTGILHRDISYTNILVKHYGDGASLLKVSDFGLVKRPNSNLTRQGTEIKGAINDYTDLTAVGFENYEIRHETYALGKVIYFILTGRTTGYHRETNEALKEFISRAISPDKSQRFTSIEEMKAELYSKVFPSLRKESAE
ncbi:serine/threonine protein kinase [Paenibacillus sp. B-A-8]|uniref:serine/threonine protein kinase n=1 Tax=Paenibacillus sp. B-A-8 TaxID=3400419 RepID=UPI003B01B842